MDIFGSKWELSPFPEERILISGYIYVKPGTSAELISEGQRKAAGFPEVLRLAAEPAPGLDAQLMQTPLSIAINKRPSGTPIEIYHDGEVLTTLVVN